MKKISATLITLLLGLCLLSGCNNKEAGAEKVADKFLTELYAGNYDKARTYTGNKDAEATVNLIAALNSSDDSVSTAPTDFEIIRTETAQDTVTCFYKEKDEEGNLSENESKIRLTRIDGDWKVVDIPFK